MAISQTTASMTVTEQMVATIEPIDTEGNPTDPNTIVWTSSDESIAVVIPVQGGLNCNIIAGNVGECKVVVNANAVKGGKGAKPVLGVLALTVSSGDVAGVTIKTSPPVEQGTAPDQGLPSRPPRPNQGLPGSQPLPDQGLPAVPVRPDQGLPSGSGRPDQGLPPTGEPKRR